VFVLLNRTPRLLLSTKWQRLLVLLVALAYLVTASSARADDGTLAFVTGTVTDSFDLPVADAKVTLVAYDGNSLACDTIRKAVLAQYRAGKLDPVHLPASAPSISPALPSVKANANGQYDIENIHPGDYAVVSEKGTYGCGAVKVTVAATEAHHYIDLHLTSPVLATAKMDDSQPQWQVTFANYSKRDMTVVYWMYSCYNINRGCADNTQTSARTNSLYSFVLRAKSTNPVTAFSITPSDNTPNGGVLPNPGDKDAAARTGFSARVSYCYFASADVPGDHDSIDVVTWPGKGSCRDIISAPASEL